MTQRGRIEAALRGVRLNTDAIDNSAGVNTSDIEVNIKIALARPVRDGRLTLDGARRAARRDDRGGGGAGAAQQLPADAGALARRAARARGSRLPAAPDADAGSRGRARPRGRVPARRQGDRRAPPPLAGADAAGARRCCSPMPSCRSSTTCWNRTCRTIPISARELGRYFPAAIVEQFPDALEHHRLRREIIATQLANSMINRGGPSLVVRIADQTGASAASIAAAFAAVRDSYGMTALNAAIDALDNKIPGKLQLELYAAVQDLLLDRAGLVPAQRRSRARASPRSSSTIATASRRSRPRSTARSPDEAADGARGARGRARRQPACRRRWRAGSPTCRRSPPRPTSCWSPTAPGRTSPRSRPPISRPSPSSGSTASRSAARDIKVVRLFRPAGARPRARFDRRCRAPPRRRDGRQRRRRRRGGRSLGRAAQGRGRAHPLLGARDRQFRADAVEAVGGGEPAGRSGEAVSGDSRDTVIAGRDLPPEHSLTAIPFALTEPARVSMCRRSAALFVAVLRPCGSCRHAAQARRREVEGRPRNRHAKLGLAAKEITQSFIVLAPC